MSMLALTAVAFALALALISLGGGLYEVSVVDPAWPRRLDLIQPSHGGVSRRWFWIPACRGAGSGSRRMSPSSLRC
jgi:hypothetical protein